jgi:pre-rRNA-processing protein TSR3
VSVEPVHPPTIIVVHPKERRSKCSVEPLRGREDFIFWTFPEPGEESLDNYVRLGFGGPVLNAEDDGHRGLLVLDGTWKLAGRMENVFNDIPIRSIPETTTAYPRKSKVFDDPHGGLATIEAIYVANKLLNRPTSGLLDKYYWREQFLGLNGFEAATSIDN